MTWKKVAIINYLIGKAGHTLDAANFDLVEIASHTHGSTIMEIGDSYTFKGTIDLPGIDVSDKADLKIEIFVIDPNDGEKKIIGTDHQTILSSLQV